MALRPRMNRLVTVAVFTYAHEMAVVRARLEWEGITCFTQDENTVAAHPLYSNLIGGIKLQVASSDVDRAVELLKEAGVINDGPQEETTGKDVWKSVATSFRLPLLSPKRTRQVAIGVGVALVILWLLFA